MLLMLQGRSSALCLREHGVYLELMGALKSVSAVISAAFSVNSCDMHGGVTVSSCFSAAFSVYICEVHGVFTVSSTVSAAFYVNMSDSSRRIHYVFSYFCCFLCEYL